MKIIKKLQDTKNEVHRFLISMREEKLSIFINERLFF